MLRLPTFEFHKPAQLSDAVALLGELVAAGETVKLLAGGTDLLPNMKHGITTPAHVVSLGALNLQGIEVQQDALVIGAMTPLQSLVDHAAVQTRLPALAKACHAIAGPQHRRMGTLGGNLCLDTRCLYINQSHFWRSALGFCLKKDGTVCHVVQGGKRCVAAASNDSALPLMLYGASVVLHSPRGQRELPVAELYVKDGVNNKAIAADELLAQVRVPWPPAATQVLFEKLRARQSIDFALLNLALRVDLAADGMLTACRLVVSALGAAPKQLNLDSKLAGCKLDEESIASIGKRAHDACKPLTNIATEPNWRRAMIPVLVKRALLPLL